MADMADLSLLALGLTLLALAVAVAGIHLFIAGHVQRQTLFDRLTGPSQGPAGPVPIAALPGGPGPGGTGAPAAERGRRRRFQGLDRRLRGTALGRRLRLKLHATGMDLTVGEYAAYVLAAVAVLWLLAATVLAPFFGPLAGLLALWGGSAFLDWQRARRTERFIGQLPELARLIANGTAAGLAMRTALSMAAEEMDDPAGAELSLVANQLAVGRSLEEALDELGQRLPSRELNVLVTTLILANRAGGTIVSSLRNLTATLEERKETRREVRTMLAEINATAVTVPLLGLGALLMINATAPGALGRVTSSPGGQIAMAVALALYLIGFIVVRRFGRIDV